MAQDFQAVWKFGPNGEVRLGRIKYDQVLGVIILMIGGDLAMIVLALFPFPPLFHAAQAAIAISGLFVIPYVTICFARVTRLEGDEKLLRAIRRHWNDILPLPVAAMILAMLLQLEIPNPLLLMAPPVAFVVMLGFLFYFTSARLMRWEPTTGVNPFAISGPDDEKRMHLRMTQDCEQLKALSERANSHDEALEQAFRDGRLEVISSLLRQMQETSRSLWIRANEMLNRALQYRELELRYLADVTQRRKNGLPSGGVTAPENGKRVYSEMGELLPASLSQGSIAMRRTAAFHGSANAVGQALAGRAPPVVAIVAVAGAIVMDQIYKSQALRRLKDAEGEVRTAMGTVLADCRQIETLFATRFLPDFERMMALTKDLGEIGEAQAAPDDESVQHLRMAVMAADRLLSGTEIA